MSKKTKEALEAKIARLWIQFKKRGHGNPKALKIKNRSPVLQSSLRQSIDYKKPLWAVVLNKKMVGQVSFESRDLAMLVAVSLGGVVAAIEYVR